MADGWAVTKTEACNSIQFSHMGDGAQVLGPSSTSLPGELAGGWIGSTATQIWTDTMNGMSGS